MPDRDPSDLKPRARPDGEPLFSWAFLGVGLLIVWLGPPLLGANIFPLETGPFQALLYLLMLGLIAALVIQTLRRIFDARAFTLRRIISSLKWDWEFVVCGVVTALNVWAVRFDPLFGTGEQWRMLDVLWEGMRANMVSYFTGILVILTFIIGGLSRVSHNRRIRLHAVVDLLLVFAYLFTHILIVPIIDVRGLAQGVLDPLFVALVKSVTYCAYILSAVRFYRYLIYYIIEYQTAQFERKG